jgi:hypothetical protein
VNLPSDVGAQVQNLPLHLREIDADYTVFHPVCPLLREPCQEVLGREPFREVARQMPAADAIAIATVRLSPTTCEGAGSATARVQSGDADLVEAWAETVLRASRRFVREGRDVAVRAADRLLIVG